MIRRDWSLLLLSSAIERTRIGKAIGERFCTFQLDIMIDLHTTIEVDAATAQRKTTGWLVSEVGNLLLGDTPSLVISDRSVWRVPVLLTSPERGVLGQVGVVNVDAQTGDVLTDPQLSQELSPTTSTVR